MLINCIYSHELVFKQVEYSINLFLRYANTWILDFEFDKLSLMLPLTCGYHRVFVCCVFFLHLLFTYYSFNLKLNKTALSVLLCIHEHVNDDSSESILIVLHHFGQLLIKVGEKANILVRKLRLYDLHNPVKTFFQLERLKW